MITILVADDHPALRSGICALFSSAPDIQIVGEAENAQEACNLVAKLHPRILLLDLKMPGYSPVKTEKWVRENYPETITLVLTSHDRDFYLAGMMDAGAVGYLSKTEKAENLISAIRRADQGEILFTAEQIHRVRRWRSEAGDKWNNLTQREREVLRLAVQGLQNEAIAHQLGVVLRTIAYHMNNILAKLDVNSRQEAVAWWISHFHEDL